MDISSLTIALLRASGFPARYVHGVIDVEAKRFKNWAGGFESINAATQFAPVAEYPLPALSAVVRSPKSDWNTSGWKRHSIISPQVEQRTKLLIPGLLFDPSFKQYEFQGGLDVTGISGIDIEQLAQDFVDSGQVNGDEGWVTGFDTSIMESAQDQAGLALEEHIINELTDPIVNDVMGGKQIIAQNFPYFPAGLFNEVAFIGARYAEIPASLQQSITYAFSRDIFGTLIDPLTLKYATTNNEKVTLSFRPASSSDEAALESLLPEGDITDGSQIPNIIPSYLIYVVPEIRVNGELKKAGSAMRLGEELPLTTRINFAGGRYTFPRTYNVIVGSYLSLNVISGSVAVNKLESTQGRLELTQIKLESGDDDQRESLTKEDLMGDMFHAGTLSYFAQMISLRRHSWRRKPGSIQFAFRSWYVWI